MVQKYVALTCTLLVLSCTAPAFAGDYVNMSLLPSRLPLKSAPAASPASLGLLPSAATFNSGLALALPRTGLASQDQTPPPPPRHRELTTKGKVLKWVGVGLMGTGAATMAIGAAVYNGNCNSGGYNIIDCSTVRNVYLALGGVQAGIGAVLFFVGIHNKE